MTYAFLYLNPGLKGAAVVLCPFEANISENPSVSSRWNLLSPGGGGSAISRS